MAREESEEFVRNFFRRARKGSAQMIEGLVDDPEAALDEAAVIFEGMIHDMAYVDDHTHPMAGAVFGCSASLAVYLALKKRGVDVHEFGSAMLTFMKNNPPSEPEAPEDERSPRERFDGFIKMAEASQKDAKPGEFVVEAFYDDRKEYDWGMNIKSCAICHAFSKYDAMDLVPYMCATDDLVSDRGNQGLRRTGTIAVGAHQCDFRYKREGDPLHLAPQYPARIKLD